MPALLDCLMPGCHEASPVTTPRPDLFAATLDVVQQGPQAIGHLAVFYEQSGPPAERPYIRQRVGLIEAEPVPFRWPGRHSEIFAQDLPAGIERRSVAWPAVDDLQRVIVFCPGLDRWAGTNI